MVSPLTIAFTTINATIVEPKGEQASESNRGLTNKDAQSQQLDAQMDYPEEERRLEEGRRVQREFAEHRVRDKESGRDPDY
jgi:hypothetical protein